LLPFTAVQCAGAVVASVCLKLIFPAAASLGDTQPHGSALQSLWIYLLAPTAGAICAVWTNHLVRGSHQPAESSC
ncbi:MAG: hypothetical protein ACKPJD_28260, partial [Planctomycetaceae bacterium]